MCYFLKEKTKLGIWFEKIEKEELLYEKCKRILLLVILALGVLWVLFTQCIPRADQDSVLLAAWGLKVGDYHMFEKSGYLAAFPHQSGLVLLLYLCSFLFGDYNYVAFQLMNAVFIMLTYRELEKISGYFGVKKVTRLAVLLCGILFFPLILYASFVYGMVPGLFWAVLSMRDTIAFCREQHIKQAVIAAVSIMFAVMLKSNYLIFFIGISVYLFLELLKQKKVRYVCLIVCMVILCMGQSALAKKFLEAKTGGNMNAGVSNLSYIAMGLQQNEKLCDGWYNEYNLLSYLGNDCDPKKQEEEVMANIKENLAFYEENKDIAMAFLANKVASEWNNPTFQALWVAQVCESDINQGNLVNRMLRFPGSNWIAVYLNFVQFFILLGMLVYIISLPKKKATTGEALLSVIFIGEFVFHLFWEAKCQYTLPYFTLLLPLSMLGFSRGMEMFAQVVTEVREKKKALSYSGMAKTGVVVLIFVLLLQIPAVKAMYCLWQDTDTYKQYVADYTITMVIKNGNYKIHAGKNVEFVLAEAEEGDTGEKKVILVEADTCEKKNISIQNSEESTRIQFIDTKNCIDSKECVVAREAEPEESQEWVIRRAPDGTFYIMQGIYALTYDAVERSVSNTLFTGADNQKWEITGW